MPLCLRPDPWLRPIFSPGAVTLPPRTPAICLLIFLLPVFSVSPSFPSANGISLGGGRGPRPQVCVLSLPGPVKGRCLRCPVLARREERIPGVWSKENPAPSWLTVSGGSSLLAWDDFYFGKMTSPVWGLLLCLGKQGGMKPPSGVEPRESWVQILCHPVLSVPKLPPLERRDAL